MNVPHSNSSSTHSILSSEDYITIRQYQLQSTLPSVMSAIVATPLHDPFSAHCTSHVDEAQSIDGILELLAIDQLIDNTSGVSSPDTVLLNELLSVDLEFNHANTYHHSAVSTAPELKDEKDVFLDLLRTDVSVDGVTHNVEGHHAIKGAALIDPYVKREYTSIDLSHGMYNLAAAANVVVKNNNTEQQLRDNVVMMHLLSVDDSVDNSKKYQELIVSEEYAIIGELFTVDNVVNGPQRRATLVQDLQGLLDIDHLVDLGVRKDDLHDI